MVQLKYLKEFAAVLEDYHISPQNQTVLNSIEFVPLTAPSAVGRNTIIRELLKTNKFYFIVSDTTRQPRINDGILEQNGREYWFRDEVEFLQDLKTGNFLEAAIIHNQQVSGISIRELKKAARQGKIAITDIEIIGIDNVMQAKPDTLAVFVLPPTFQEWQRRMKTRGAMTVTEYRRRLDSAAKEFAFALDKSYFRFVVNTDVTEAAQDILQLVLGKNKVLQQSKQQESCRKIAQQLLKQTQQILASGTLDL